ncbi:MAG: thiosulfate oxidation carrier complex protein SoxZ [Gammaproteobacteria bacterium]|nr:thiosulfate oxidation carrier complex protein SoxZ [Gammaproteobacteria bacterium]
MAKNTIKIRAEMKGGKANVKALFKHEMETGLAKDKKTGEKIPAHFIQEVICEHNGNKVLTANWGVAVSKNPYISFRFSGASKGDTIKISWTDNKGDSDTAEGKID